MSRPRPSQGGVYKPQTSRPVITCPNFGKGNLEGAKFCNDCASPLGLASVTQAEERKVVTVLFCDLVGFTAASDRADPEDVRARIRPYHGRLRTEIEGYGGTAKKFIGDAVMAVFGAPVAHEDDPERAVRAGLSILEAISELNEEDAGLDLQVRVGIETGEAVALGARPEQGEGIVTGDVVNTASRLQGAAPVNGVAVGEGTYAATRDVFDYEAMDPVMLKGKVEPVALWQARAARARFGTDLTRKLTTPPGRRPDRPGHPLWGLPEEPAGVDRPAGEHRGGARGGQIPAGGRAVLFDRRNARCPHSVGIRQPGSSFTFTFRKAGTYRVIDRVTFHRGSVSVK
jgi:class 3 adenylate cyclase